MATKSELKAQLEAAGIALPDNWAKMTSARAETFAKTALQKAPATGAIAGMKRRAIGLASAALAAGSALVNLAVDTAETARAVVFADPEPEDTRRPQAKAATMPKNPNWGRTERKYQKNSFYPTYPAPDPEPLTRQVRRQNERRTPKMPIGARQSAWHALMGYGPVGSGKRGAAA